MRRLRLLYASSEVAPLAKTGGLADVSAALAEALHQRGHDVRLIVPLYRRIREAGHELVPVKGLQDLVVELGAHSHRVSVQDVKLPGREQSAWCLDCPELYDRDGIYTADDDEHRRFALLTRAALTTCQASNWAPDIVHANDWHVALLPLYLKLLSSWERLFAQTRTVLTIHNLGYQGAFSSDVVHDLGLDDARHLLHQEDMAAGWISFLKTGLLYADVITTVSKTYAREIQTREHGMGLHEMLKGRAESLVGIVNGIDSAEWSPERDTLIPRRFSVDTLKDKRVNKTALLKSLGLPAAGRQPGGRGVPVFGIVSRLVYQKGFELLFEPLREMLRHHDVRLVVLGSGQPDLERSFALLQRDFPGRVCFYKGYSNALAHLIEAGADFFLMPSRYEPCGLNQMYSLAYGTVPIVRRTGGLADTVQLYDPGTGEGTGIVFDDFDVDAIRRALAFALELYHEGPAWRRVQRNGMSQDFSWERQAGRYEELYHQLLER